MRCSILCSVSLISAAFFVSASVSASESSAGTLFRELLPFSKARGIGSGASSPSNNHANGQVHDVHMQAQRGSVEAFYILGLFHLYGMQNLEPKEEAAKTWFLKAASEGHNDAQCVLGLLLYHGHGQIEVDRAAAKSYFQFASNDNHPYGHWLLGRLLFEGASTSVVLDDTVKENDFAEAASLFGLAAVKIPDAAHQLAIMYEYGLVGEKGELEDQVTHSNLLKAAELYEKSARQGFVESIYHLALMYAYGRGVPRDYMVATELFQISASNQQQPHAPSMRYLAMIYANGYHPSNVQDYDVALQWYKSCVESEDFPDVREICIVEEKALSNVINAARVKT